jgi:hypothetical protein
VKSQSTSLLVDADTDFESKDGCLAVMSCGSLDSHTIFVVVLGAVFESSVGTENSHHGDPDGFFANLKKKSAKFMKIGSKCSGAPGGTVKF